MMDRSAAQKIRNCLAERGYEVNVDDILGNTGAVKLFQHLVDEQDEIRAVGRELRERFPDRPPEVEECRQALSEIVGEELDLHGVADWLDILRVFDAI